MTKKRSKKKNSPKKLHSSKLDGNLLNLYDDDVMSDDVASCYNTFGGEENGLSILDDNGLNLMMNQKIFAPLQHHLANLNIIDYLWVSNVPLILPKM